MHIHPCNGCPMREGCELREEFRARAKTAKCTSIKFRCTKLLAEMRPGRRIIIETPRFTLDPSASDYYGETVDYMDGEAEVKATITAVKGYKYTCTLDPEQEHGEQRFRRWKPHRRIVRFLDEPDAHVCSQGQVVRDGLCDRTKGFFTGDREQPEKGLCHCGLEQWETGL